MEAVMKGEGEQALPGPEDDDGRSDPKNASYWTPEMVHSTATEEERLADAERIRQSLIRRDATQSEVWMKRGVHPDAPTIYKPEAYAVPATHILPPPNYGNSGKGVVDMVERPPHYANFAVNGVELIDLIEAYKLNFRIGLVAKYIFRAGRKGDRLEDLKKARWYLNREIAALEKEPA